MSSTHETRVVPTWHFDRYVNGVLMAQGVTVDRESTLEAASKVAARIASKGPNRETPVLVLTSPLPAPAAPAPEPVAISEIVKRIRMTEKYWDADVQRERYVWRGDDLAGLFAGLLTAPPAPVAASAVDALRPFAAAVHNDNGDVTISTGHLRKGDYIRAHHAVRAASAPLDPVESLFAAARDEAARAMRKFPQPNYVISKIAEEAGEVVKAAIHCAEGRETPEAVVAEIRQAMALLIRLFVEGDQVHGLLPLAAAPALPATAEGRTDG